ncbi:UNVERIFIED_CONTAM: hypothetical protein Sradi_3664400 [Sesamum radiatum]|uniref:Myb/SANT-like domain-containing protein n=1 Tax=Sesamum radiatum TaxID=300843 RepID=A0AAW2QIU0_SESRA
MGKQRKQGVVNESRRDRMSWSAEMDEILLDTFVAEDEKGNRHDGIWTSTAFDNIVKVCVEKFGHVIEKENVKNRQKTLKTNFAACYDAFRGHRGFAWNPKSQLFEAELEVWKEMLESENYDVSAKATILKRKAKSSDFQVRKIALVEKQIEVINIGITGVADALKEGNAIAKESLLIAERKVSLAEKSRPRTYSEEELIVELQNIGIPSTLFVDVVLYFLKNHVEMHAFLHCLLRCVWR